LREGTIPLPDLMNITAEVIGLLDSPADCSKLLYAPLSEPLTYRQTRRYHLEYSGSEEVAKAFVEKVLFDQVSEGIHFGDGAALEGARFALDYGMKPGALDLEMETVMRYYRETAEAGNAGGLEIHDFKIFHRIYVFSADDGAIAEPDRFIKDVCNPAIHTWSVTDARDLNA
jgi:hypothetical protein